MVPHRPREGFEELRRPQAGGVRIGVIARGETNRGVREGRTSCTTHRPREVELRQADGSGGDIPAVRWTVRRRAEMPG